MTKQVVKAPEPLVLKSNSATVTYEKQQCANISEYGGGNQAYSRLSTAHGHITDCKLDSVVFSEIWRCESKVLEGENKASIVSPWPYIE